MQIGTGEPRRSIVPSHHVFRPRPRATTRRARHTGTPPLLLVVGVAPDELDWSDGAGLVVLQELDVASGSDSPGGVKERPGRRMSRQHPALCPCPRC